jgi:hypothetical protein
MSRALTSVMKQSGFGGTALWQLPKHKRLPQGGKESL